MYTLQTDAQREQIRTASIRYHQSNMNSVHHQSRSTLQFNRTAVAAANAWNHRGMEVTMRDLLNSNVNPKEENHMALPYSGNVEKTQAFFCSSSSGRNSRSRRPRDSMPSSIASSSSSSGKTKCHPSPYQLPSSLFDTSSCQTLPLHEQQYDRLDPRVRGEFYPRYRLDTIFNDDGTCRTNSLLPNVGKPKRVSRCPTVATASTSSTTTASHCNDDASSIVSKPSTSFLREQEQLFQQFANSRRNTNQRRNSRHHVRPNEPAPRSFQSFSSTESRSTAASSTLSSVSGTRVKILDASLVHKAFEKGTATVLKCLGCNKHMLGTSDIKLLFCPACGTLSPVDLAKIHSGRTKYR